MREKRALPRKALLPMQSGAFGSAFTYRGRVILLDKSPRIAPAQLPAAGSNDNLPPNQQFTSVGYGTLAAQNGPGGHTFPIDDVRKYAVGTLNSVTKSWLRISQNASHGDGGTCYGDSGGPNFRGAGSGETNVIAATTITGDT